ncbi:MAG: DNA gyrase subunit A, partial [Bacilli bacterium]|nr:DNA gyrase subunit A [Bacilli bacterium]
IDATIKRIDSPNCTLDTLMGIVKGPDFPTGAIVEGIDGIRKAYESGRGKVIIKARTSFEESKGKLALIITEIPYEVNKAQLVRKIDEIRIDKKVEGILEVRDESDRDGLRIAIDLKKDCNKDVILNYLLKNTDLQVSYNFNMIAIVNRAPKQLGLAAILDAYIVHQKEVIIKRTKFDLEHAKARLHIVEGLIRCLSILDEVIAVIRGSKNKSDARENLVKEFGFTEAQAEAIITLQLYRLTNTDVTLLEEELKNLKAMIEGLQAILDDENVLKNVMKDELRKIKKEYATARKTDIKDEITDIKIDSIDMITKEDAIVMVTKDGYIKRTSLRSYQASGDDIPLKDNDYVLGLYELNTLDVLLLFTNLGNYLYIPVHTIPSLVWKDLGKHVSNLIKLEQDEEIISVVPVTDFDSKEYIVIATVNGMIKKTSLEEFKSIRNSKPICCMKLKDDDAVIDAFLLKEQEIFISTANAYGLWFDSSEIPVVGLKTSGVKSINLKDDKVVSVSNFNKEDTEYISIITEKGTGKRVKLSEFDKSSRAKRGLMILREVKTNPYRVIKSFAINAKHIIGLKGNDIKYIKLTELSIVDRYSTGTTISKEKLKDAFIVTELQKRDTIKDQNNNVSQDSPTVDITDEVSNEEELEFIVEEVEVKKEPEVPKRVKDEILLREIDDRLMTIEDFLNSD